MKAPISTVKRQIKIAIAEDHLMFRQGVLKMLEDYEDIKVLFHVSNGKELLDELKRYTPDIILLDIEMPIMHGKVVMEKLKAKHSKIKIIIVTQHLKNIYLLQYVKLGAASFLAKNEDIERIVDAIYAVYENGTSFDNHAANILRVAMNSDEGKSNYVPSIGAYITDRELDIVKKLAEGKTANQIADELFIAPKTVENHKASLFKKTNCHNTASLIKFARDNNLI